MPTASSKLTQSHQQPRCSSGLVKHCPLGQTITSLDGNLALDASHKCLYHPPYFALLAAQNRSLVEIPVTRSSKSKSQLLDLFHALFAVQSEPYQVLVEHLACQIGVHTSESHALRNDAAGHNLSAVKRSERRNPLLDVHLRAILVVIEWLDNDVHVVELPRYCP